LIMALPLDVIEEELSIGMRVADDEDNVRA
jgi:hypothetical protein